MSSGLVLGRMIGPLRIFNSTYGHCFRLRMMEPFFSEVVRFFRFSSSSFLRGRRTGGRSGAILILSLWDFRCLAFCNHWLRCCKSLKRIITPALSLFASLWQAAKSNSEASEILRCSLASLTQALRVTSSSSFAAPFSP